MTSSLRPVSELNRRVILVVDDDVQVRVAVRACLEHGGYSVHEAQSGAEALRGLLGPPPALIILDLTMSSMDGLAFIAALQQRGLRSTIPILLLSANDDLERIATACGVEGYLKKPMRAATLLEAVSRLLSE